MSKRDKIIISCAAIFFLCALIVYLINGGDFVKLFWNQDAFDKATSGGR